MSAEVNPALTFGGSIPKIYDEVLGPVYFEPYAIETAERVSRLNPFGLLETACGTGRVTVHLRNKIKGNITATDINPQMMAIAKHKLQGKEITWQLADATALPFENESFDCIVSQFGVMFYPDKALGMKEAYRILKPGGTFIFTVWGKLEANPMSATGREIVGEYFKNDIPPSYKTAYSMHDVLEVKDIVRKSGFKNITEEVLTKECTCDSAWVMAAGLVEGNQIVNAIREKDESAIGILKEKVFETLVKRYGDHPCQTTMQAIVFTAKK
jgi:ubiquinone/menaquinone biosynthesis C-methylase UbiE